MDIASSDENLSNRKTLTEGGLEGVQYDFMRDVNGLTFRYRLRILQGHDEGYLVAAWTQRRAADADAILNDALTRIKFAARASVHPPTAANAQMVDRERQAGGFVLNQAGLFHTRKGECEKSLPLFCAAVRANKEESVYALNALYAWRHLDRPKAALAFLDSQPAALLAVPAIRANQAYFQAQSSLIEEAITNYAGLFATGYRDDDHLTEYVTLLTERKQYDLALTELQKYLKAEDSMAARLLEARIYCQQRDFPRAIQLLKEMRLQDSSSSRVANALADAFLQAGQYSEALAVSQELVKDNGSPAYANYLKGRSELGLKWYREAKASFGARARDRPLQQQ